MAIESSTLLLAIYLTVFLGFNVPLLLLKSQAIREVNEHTSDKFSLWMWNWPRSRLWSEHKRYVPKSRVRLYYWLTFTLAVFWMFLGLGILQWLTH